MPTVLVIDENRGVLDTIGRVLRGAGFRVALACTGQDGLRLAHRRPIDLVVADLRLTDITGIDVLRRLRQELIDIPVIVTGLSSTPVIPDRLVDIVRSYAPSRHAASARHAGRISPHVIRTTRVIEERYAEPNLQVGAVAHELGLSTEHLCRVLKRHTGLTFVTLLRRARVRAACRLLHATMLSMKQIAGRVGFSSASRFDHDFKDVCGVSPSAYRAEIGRHPHPFALEG